MKQESTASFQRTLRSLALVREMPFSKVKLTFIGQSGSNRSLLSFILYYIILLYLYRATIWV